MTARRWLAVLIALGAAAAWAVLLLTDAAVGPLGAAASTLGAVIRIPAPALLAVTILYPALIAWSAATATVVAAEYLRPVRTTPPVA